MGEQGWQATYVRLDPEMHRRVKENAAANDRTMAQTIRRALRRYLDSEEVDGYGI